MERERVTVTITEFARIVGVDHAVVFRAIKKGVRLQSSIVKQDGKTRIAVCDGCIEWVLGKDERKDHRMKGAGYASSSIPGIMPREVSAEMDRHYSALMKQMEYGRFCGELMPMAKFAEHARECLQTCRNTLWNLHLVVSEQARSLLYQVVRPLMGDGSPSPELQESMDNAVLQLRVATQREVRKALSQAADIILNEAEKEKAIREIQSI